MNEHNLSGDRSVTKFPSSTLLSDILRIQAGVNASVIRNRTGEPVFVTEEGVPPGSLSRATAEAQLDIRPEAVISVQQAEQVIYGHF